MVRVLYLIKASVLTARRYSIDWWGSILLPIVNVIPFLVAIFYAEYVGWIDRLSLVLGTSNYVLYYAIGIVYWNYVESLWTSAMTLRYYMRVGLFEDIFALPITAFEFLLGWAILEIATVTTSSAPLIIIVVIIIMIETNLYNVFLCALIFLISLLASFGFTFILFGATLVFREGDDIVSLVGNVAPLLGGLYFPVSLLPESLRFVGYLFPFTWGLDLMRFYLLSTYTILPVSREIPIFLCICCIYFVGGIVIYRFLEVKARQRGVQGF